MNFRILISILVGSSIHLMQILRVKLQVPGPLVERGAGQVVGAGVALVVELPAAMRTLLTRVTKELPQLNLLNLLHRGGTVQRNRQTMTNIIFTKQYFITRTLYFH